MEEISNPQIWRNIWNWGKLLGKHVSMMGLHQITSKEQIWRPQLPQSVPLLEIVSHNSRTLRYLWEILEKSPRINSTVYRGSRINCSLVNYVRGYIMEFSLEFPSPPSSIRQVLCSNSSRIKPGWFRDSKSRIFYFFSNI